MAPQTHLKNLKWFKLHSKSNQKRFEVETQKAPQTNLKNLKWFKFNSKSNQNDLRLNLKGASNQSQEPQMVQIPFKKQSKRFEVEPQRHLKLSHNSLDRTPHRFEQGPRSKHVHNLLAHIPDDHPLLDVELSRASCLCWKQATRMHSDMHGRHGERMAMWD